MTTISHTAAAQAAGTIAGSFSAIRPGHVLRYQLLLLCFGLCLMAPGSLSAEGEFYNGVAIERPPSHEALAARLRQSQQNNPLADLKPAEPSLPEVEQKPSNLLEECEFLSFNGFATLLPKGAIVKMPPEFETRRGYSQGSKLVSWSQFLVLNRGWITTIEVTRLQAEGNEAFGNSITSLLERTKMMVVATFSQCPTSVLPPKEPPEITSTTTRP